MIVIDLVCLSMMARRLVIFVTVGLLWAALAHGQSDHTEPAQVQAADYAPHFQVRCQARLSCVRRVGVGQSG
jgi:hypothetical protein